MKTLLKIIKGLLIAAAIFIGGIFLISSLIPDDAWLNRTNDAGAYRYSRELMTAELKAPSQAVFPEFSDIYPNIKRLPDSQVYEITAYVDAPNSLGVMKRIRYYAKVEQVDDGVFRRLEFRYEE